MHHAATFLLACCLLLTGCGNTVGPRALASGRPSYNEAIQVTAYEELLKNIVRLRYDEMPFFLDIRQINTSFQNIVAVNAGLTTEKPINVPTGTIVDHHIMRWGFGARWQFEERPTITYVPNQGQKYASEYLTPISQEVLLKLYYSGWSIDRILRLCVQEMKGIRNAPTATGPTPHRAPEYAKFREICDLLKRMQDRNLISMTVANHRGEPVAILQIEKDEGPHALGVQLRSLLGVEATTQHVIFTRRIATSPNEVTITPRTVMGVLRYVSQGVEVPERAVDHGEVVQTCTDDGSCFDWQEVLGQLFRVQSGPWPPDNATVATRRGRDYYWIAANDLESKRTFHFISQLTTLVAGKFDSPAPILTVPVN